MKSRGRRRRKERFRSSILRIRKGFKKQRRKKEAEKEGNSREINTSEEHPCLTTCSETNTDDSIFWMGKEGIDR